MSMIHPTQTNKPAQQYAADDRRAFPLCPDVREYECVFVCECLYSCMQNVDCLSPFLL